MSKIDELIQELCPDGVKFLQLSEVAVTTIGEFVHKNKQKPDGLYPVYNGGRSETGFYDRYNNNGNKIVISARGAYAGFVNRVVKPYWAGNSSYSISIKNTDQTDWGYLYYYLKKSESKFTESQQKGGIPAVSKKQVESFKIPIPPLEVQKEIVNILDKFTQLEAELSAELEARRRQYEFYRSSLLTPDQDVEYFFLQDLCTVITDGSHFSPKATEKGYYMPSVKDMRSNGFDLSSCKKISEKDYEILAKNGCRPQKNDVLIAKDGSMLKYAFSVEEEQNLVVLSSIAILRTKLEIINPKYLAHYFGQEKFKETVIRNFSSKGGVPRIVLKNFKRVKIPVPSLTKQNDIVNILDAFDVLVNDINNGLPAEITARRKQYEYYRTKLLTFQELK